MEFTERYHWLKEHFDPSKENSFFPGTNVGIRFLNFESGNVSKDEHLLPELRKVMSPGTEDEQIEENKHFSYPVFYPLNRPVNDHAILLLHGLNERRWDKYLTWAHYLVEKTGKSVIIFPISFHISRSYPLWFDVRLLNSKAEERKAKIAGVQLSTYANLTLSERLSEHPERFLLAGFQTANDIVKLATSMRKGEHPMFSKDSNTDLFAYSIGGLLAQVLMIANPSGLFSRSKLFLFCAGSTFSYMNGVSKVIMDSVANDNLHYYYQYELEKKLTQPGILSEFFHDNRLAIAFRAMIAPHVLKRIREKVFTRLHKQIYAISFRDDQIIPAIAVSETLMGSNNKLPDNMEVLHYDYPYTHEMPFPVKCPDLQALVDEAFERVFSKAALFLA
jgi:hypothetical protein